MNKVTKLAILADRIEQGLTHVGKLKLAKKRLTRVAGLDDPEAYSKKSHVQKDNAKESSKQKEDTTFEKRQTEINKEESAVK